MPQFGTPITSGNFATGTGFATNELPVDMHKKTMSALANLAPLTTILTRLANDKAHNFRIDWQEDADIPHTVTVATTESSATTPVVFVSGGYSLVEGTLLFNPRTFDIRYCTATPTSATSIAVTTGYAGTTAAVWNSGDVIHVLSPNVAENDEQYRPSSVPDTNVFNYEQLIRMQFKLTRVSNDVSTHFGGPGSKREQLKHQKYREFRIKWDKLIMFGGRSTGGTAPATFWTMGGLTHYLKDGTLYKDFNGVFTESGFDNLLLSYHEENPDATNVDLFCAPAVSQKISYWGKDKIRISPDSKKYGLALKQYLSAGLMVNIIELPLLSDSQTKGWGWLLDTTRVRLKNLSNPMFFPEALNVGQSEYIIDTYRVNTSLMVANESRHAMFIGATL